MLRLRCLLVCVLNVPWLQQREGELCRDFLLMGPCQKLFPTYSSGHDVLTLPPSLSHSHAQSLSLSYSLCRFPPPPMLSSLLLASPKINLTSEGHSLKCLLNVFLSPAASLCYPFPILSLSIMHSSSLMCKHVCSLNPLCIPFVVNVVVPYCLIARTLFTNAVRQLGNSILLFEAMWGTLLLWV